MRPTLCLLSAFAAGVITVPCCADLIRLDAWHDNTLYEDATGSRANGSGPTFFAGETARQEARRALISFDIAGNIPAGSVIDSVTLKLHVSRTPAGSSPIALHRVSSAWGEGPTVAFGEGGDGGPSLPGDATWVHTFYDTQFWNTAGGDFDAPESASISVAGEGFYTWSSSPMATETQDWLDNPAGNFGWLLQGDEGFPATGKRFDSRENPDPLARPSLIVDYRPVPGPGGLALVAAASVISLCPRRRARTARP